MKVGVSSGLPHEPVKPNKAMVEAARNFRESLDNFNNTKDNKVKKHDMDRMVREMDVIESLGQSIDRKETRVLAQKVSKDFILYHKNPSKENYNVLEHDLNVLRESLEH
ncbi:MAG TPA: hypothetical protein VLG44_08890 [Chlamydiales bacterium]|nr:hypothetical protein [Chlamydiales bacterium]